MEFLQVQCSEEWGLSRPDFPQNLQKQREELLSRLPSPYKEAAGRLYSTSPSVLDLNKRLTEMIRAEIQKLLPEKDWQRVADVPAGILPSAELNGFAIRTASGGNVVVLNAGLIGVLHGVNKTFMKLTLAEEGEGTKMDLEEAESLIKRFPEYARSVISLNRITPPKSLPVGKGQMAIANIYTNIQELFFFVHEYQHILLGHLDDYASTISLLQIPEAVDVYTQSQQQEMSADTAAMETIRHAGHGDPNIQAAALALVFSLLSLCESMDDNVDKRPTTHPPAAERKRNILSCLDKDIHQGGRDLLRKIDVFFEYCRT
jgi:hypothetical protein